MRGRNLGHKIAFFKKALQIPDATGGFVETFQDIGVFNIQMDKARSNVNLESFQEGVDLSYNCSMIFVPYFLPSANDVMVVDGSIFTIADAYKDETKRIPLLKFKATIRR